MKKNDAKKVLVNGITSLRLLGTVFLPFIFLNFGALITGILTTFLLATDALDGIMARKLKVSTFLGATLDSVADKLIAIMALIVAFVVDPVLVVPMIALEGAIVGVNAYNAKKGANVQSSMLGKTKTYFLFTTIVILLIGYDIGQLSDIINYSKTSAIAQIAGFIDNNHESINTILAGSTIGLQAATLVDYKRQAKKSVNNMETNEEKEKLKDLKIQLIDLKNIVNKMWDEEFYEENKNESQLKLIKSIIDKRKLYENRK